MRHPDELLHSLTSRQLAEWLAFYRLQPFGQDHSDRMIAQMTAILDARWRGKNEEPLDPADLMPQMKREQTPEQIQATLKGILGGI